MSRRLEVELTSRRDDGSWTWRAAGARQPKGVLDGGLLTDDVNPGDVVKVEADFDLDGIVVTQVIPSREKRSGPERLELLGSGAAEGGVTTSLVPGRRRDATDDRRDRRPGRGGGRRSRGDGDAGRGERSERPRRDGGRGRGGDERPGGDAPARTEGRRRERPAGRPPRDEPADDKPRARRLRPGRTHRNAWVASLPDEQKPVAEQLVLGGIPAVRRAIDTQNDTARQQGLPEVKADPLVEMAETLLPRLRTAEWRDRADAALGDIDEIDLRDLRSVVVAAEDGARGEESRALAEELRAGLARRVEDEHRAWLDEVATLVHDGRVVRALRVSSRPPKAGEPFPRDLAESLAGQAGAAMSSDISQQRWGAILEAVAFSPVRTQVTPAHFPEKPDDELQVVLAKVASRLPEVAAHYGVSAKRRRRRPAKPPAPGAPSAQEKGDTPDRAPSREPDAPLAATSGEKAAAPTVEKSPVADAADAAAGPGAESAAATPAAAGQAAPAADQAAGEEPAGEEPAGERPPVVEPPGAGGEGGSPAAEGGSPVHDPGSTQDTPAPSGS